MWHNELSDEFEWDEAKRLLNIQRHNIDFDRAREIWLDNVVEISSGQTQHGEERFLATGFLNDRLITIVYTWRGHIRRIISARAARKHERENYQSKAG